MTTWHTTPCPVLLQRHVRNSKFEPLADEIELIEANPSYAHICLPDGTKDTVSLKHLAPQGNTNPQCQNEIETQDSYKEKALSSEKIPNEQDFPQFSTEIGEDKSDRNQVQLRRS